MSWMDELRKLKGLLDDGLISHEEYEEERIRIMEQKKGVNAKTSCQKYFRVRYSNVR